MKQGRRGGKVLGPLVGVVASIMLAFMIGFPALAVEETPPVLRQVGLETGDFTHFERVRAASGSITVDTQHTYGGDYSAHAAYEGGNQPGYSLTGFDVNWTDRDDVWYGGGYYLPETFPGAQQSDITIVAWDNRPTYGPQADYGGIVIAASTHKAYLVRGNATERQVLATPVEVPFGRWFFLEVHQLLDGVRGVNEVYVDGELESKSEAANTYGRAPDQVRYGMLGLQQPLPLELWFDRAVARKSGSNRVCNWEVTASPWMTESGSWIAAAKHDDGYPVGCWRPYSDDSPFNQRLPENPQLDPRSAEMVQRLTEAGDPTDRRAGIADTSSDFYKPTYWARNTDPLVRLDSTGSAPTIDGDVIRVPLGARPAGGSDRHMTIVQPDGWEYDLWHASPVANGVLSFNAGRRIRIDGDGLNSAATASRFGNLAGRIRAQEMEAGQINHAFFMAASSTARTAVYPADKSDGNNDAAAGYPPMGARFQLQITDAELSRFPPWKQTVLRAFRDYGGFLGDTTESPWTYAAIESGSSYTSFGLEDRMVTFARQAMAEGQSGISRSGGVYYFDVASGIDWGSRLRVIDPCVSERSC
jgi:hypothetical protein